MAASPQATGTSTFGFSNQNSKPASLDRSTIIWLVVLACIIAVAFTIVACLLCRCRRKRKNGRVSRGYSIHDGRHYYHPWNRHASPMPPIPPPAYMYGSYGDVKSKADQTSIAVPSQAARRSSVVMELMVVEEAGDGGEFRRSKKTSRYYGGLSARFSRMSQIGRAM